MLICNEHAIEIGFYPHHIEPTLKE